MDLRRHEFILLNKTKWGKKLWSDKHKRKIVKTACKELMSKTEGLDKLVVFGTDELAQRLGKEFGDKCKFFIETETDGSQYIQGKPVKKYNELILMDRLQEYAIVISPDRNMIGNVDKLLQMGISWRNIIVSNLTWSKYSGGKAYDTYDTMLGYARQGNPTGFTIFEENENSGGVYVHNCNSRRVYNRSILC